MEYLNRENTMKLEHTSLIERIDDYINYWRKAVEEVEQVYPQALQSTELKRLITGLKQLIGTYSISQYNSAYSAGNAAATFNPFTRNLMNRLIPNETNSKSEEKTFIHTCIDENKKDDASKLLRLITMMEHESANLHYAIVMHFWLDSEDVRLAAYFDTKDEYHHQINLVREKLDILSNKRETSDLLFSKDWSYLKNNHTTERVSEIGRSLEQTRQAVATCFKQETEIDQKVLKTRNKLLETMSKLQHRVNEVLLKIDQNKLVQVPAKAGDSEWSLMKMFDEPKSPSGLLKTDIAKFQRGDDYSAVKQFLAESYGRLCSDYNEIIVLTNQFTQRADFRAQAKSRVGAWSQIAEQKLDTLVDEERTKARLVKLYEANMMDEMRSANGGEHSLCYAFEKLFTEHASSLSDGNWDEIGETIATEKSPTSCLKRENIAVFRKTLLNYKEASSARRSAFSTINKAIIGLLGIVAVFFAVKGFLSVLPGTVKATQIFTAISAALHLPIAVAVLVPLAIIGMIALNIRNAKTIRDQFESALIGYGDAPKDAVDEAPCLSTYQRFSNQVKQVFSRSWWQSRQDSQMSDNEYIDEARFVGQDRTSRMTEEVIFRNIDDDQINTERTSSFTSVDLSDSPRRDNDNSNSHNSGNGISV
jgi:hypothetical protein